MKSNRFDKIIYWTNGIILGILVGVGAQVAFATWTAPISAPPNDNVPAPLTISADNQTKSGGLTAQYFVSVGNIQAGANFNGHQYMDSDDINYYTDPHWWSRINNLIVMGDTVVTTPDDADDIARADWVNSRVHAWTVSYPLMQFYQGTCVNGAVQACINACNLFCTDPVDRGTRTGGHSAFGTLINLDAVGAACGCIGKASY